MWREHDPTHLELAVTVPVASTERGAQVSWEAYFFVPDSFALNRIDYGKDALDADFKSYVRLAVADTRAQDLMRALAALDEREVGLEQARLFACRVRQVLVSEVARAEAAGRVVDGVARGVVVAVIDVLAGYRARTETERASTGELGVAVRWVDEHLSLQAETALVKLAELSSQEVREELIDCAVAEARYRKREGYAAVVTSADEDAPTSRDMERIEFRRHTLKRFTSSLLWLDMRAQDPSRWAKQALYAVAAGFAMAFAVAAALWNGVPSPNPSELGMWLLVAILAYAVKDRIKATLQELFSGVLNKRFPDRRWQVRGKNGDAVAVVDERSGFASFENLPEPVLAARRITRQHPIEEEARPETVLWHHKTIRRASRRVSRRVCGAARDLPREPAALAGARRRAQPTAARGRSRSGARGRGGGARGCTTSRWCIDERTAARSTSAGAERA